MLIKPSAKLELDYRVSFLESTPSQSPLVAASEDGCISIISPNFAVQTMFICPSKIQAVSLHPSLPRIALVEGDDGHLCVMDTSGKRLFETQAPEQSKGTSDWIPQGFSSCFFDFSGIYLWCAAAISDYEVEIQLRECTSWRIVDTTIIEDPYGGSAISFYPTGKPNMVVLWLAAGQDGQQVYWVKREMNGIVCHLEPYLENTLPPVFSPSGKEFLTLNDVMNLNKYQFPDIRLLSEYQWLASEEEAEPEESFGNYLCYLNESWALVSSSEDRLYMLNLVEMSIKIEVFIEGHEPKPISEVFPRLINDSGLCTDMSRFQRFGDVIVSVHRRPNGAWEYNNTLLCFPVRELQVPSVSCNEMRQINGTVS